MVLMVLRAGANSQWGNPLHGIPVNITINTIDTNKNSILEVGIDGVLVGIDGAPQIGAHLNHATSPRLGNHARRACAREGYRRRMTQPRQRPAQGRQTHVEQAP